MINSRLYKLRQEYLEDLQKRLEEEYSCSECSKKEVNFSIYKEKRTWDVKAVCSCGCEELYSDKAEFRGYIIAQYKYILKTKNPDIKIKFHKDKKSTKTPPKKPTKAVKKEPPQQHIFNAKKPLIELDIVRKNKDLDDK